MTEERRVVKPDLAFVEEMQAAGAGDLKKCYQCAACSAVCSLSPPGAPYPRRQMILAQWGEKESLMADPQPWLCHQCGDCQAACPRGARPGDVMAALRRAQVARYARPAILGKLAGEAKYLPILFAAPVALIGVLLAAFGLLRIPEGPVHYGAFFPHLHLNIAFTTLLLLALVGACKGARDFWNAIEEQAGPAPAGAPSFYKAYGQAFIELLAHKRFARCDVNKSRYYGHLLALWGFAVLLVVTAVVVVYAVLGLYPLELSHPLKIAGNLGGVAFIAGCLIILKDRLADPETTGRPTAFDWTFIAVLLGVGLSGFLVQAARLGDWRTIAYHIYFTHLVLVYFLLIYFPYTKFAHVIYRLLAIAHAKTRDLDIDLRSDPTLPEDPRKNLPEPQNQKPEQAA